MGACLTSLKPNFNRSVFPCTRTRHKFVRYTRRAWRLVGLAQPLPEDVCRKCGRLRVEVTVWVKDSIFAHMRNAPFGVQLKQTWIFTLTEITKRRVVNWNLKKVVLNVLIGNAKLGPHAQTMKPQPQNANKSTRSGPNFDRLNPWTNTRRYSV